jgi:hypothetical protein
VWDNITWKTKKIEVTLQNMKKKKKKKCKKDATKQA